jgi:hypothetical protein
MKSLCDGLVVAALADGRQSLVAPARQGLWPATWEKRPAAVAHYRRIKPDSGNQQNHGINDISAVAGWGGPRFLVPQYEGDDPFGCCAAPTRDNRLTLSAPSAKV